MQNEVELNKPNGRESEDEHFLLVQANIFNDLIKKEGVTDIPSFIESNAHLFRYFATHLPGDLQESWMDAEFNEDSREKLEAEYESFRMKLDTFIAKLDSESKVAIHEAISKGDTDLVSSILKQASRPLFQ